MADRENEWDATSPPCKLCPTVSGFLVARDKEPR